MESSWHLHTEGWLPGWAGLLLFLLVGAFLLFQLRRELSRVRRSVLTTTVLPSLRVAVCGLVVWLLCRPVFTRVVRTRQPPRFLLLTAGGHSLRTKESFDDLGRKIDLLENLTGQSLKTRKRDASRLARTSQDVIALVGKQQDALQKELANVASGLPLDPNVPQQIRVFGKQLDSLMDAMRADSETPAQKKDALRKERLAMQAQRRDLVGRLGAIAGECDLVVRESLAHPDVLRSFSERLGPALETAQRLRRMALDLQTKQDQHNITRAERAWAEQPLTRRGLAELAENCLGRQLGPNVQLDKRSAPSLESALTEARKLEATAPLAGVILLSDATENITPLSLALSRQFSACGTPVHALLIGRDRVAPADAGLVALDMPSLVLRYRQAVARMLVKNELPPNRDCRLELRSGASLIATRKLPAERRGQYALDVPLRLKEAGRTQLRFELRMSEADAYPGNELLVQTVDVLAEKIQVLLISDRVMDDFAAYRSALQTMPTVSLQTLLAAPGLSRIKVGKEPGAFPSRAEEWDGIGLVVLLGGIPEVLLGEAKSGRESPILEAFAQALNQGLHVYVHEAATVKPERSWAAFLGLAPRLDPEPGFITPAKGLWLDLHRLGLDEPSSRERWEGFGRVSTRSLDLDTGLPILITRGRAVLSLLRRGPGLVIHNGLPPISSFGRTRNAASVSRVLHGILNLALRPLPGPGLPPNAGDLFPPQPILGKDVIVWPPDLELTPQPESSRLRLLSVAQAPRDAARFTLAVAAEDLDADPGMPSLRFGTAGRERMVGRLPDLADFELTPSSAPLKELAESTGGAYADLHDPADLVTAMKKAKGQTFEKAWVLRLWRGWWSLVLLLFLVSAEYLLRRRAGRMM